MKAPCLGIAPGLGIVPDFGYLPVAISVVQLKFILYLNTLSYH